MKATIKIFSFFILILFPVLAIGQSEQEKTTIYGYKHPKTSVYYLQDRDVMFGNRMVNDALKKHKLLIVLEHEIWNNIPLKDKPKTKNGCELYRIDIYKNTDDEVILEELKVE